MNKYNLEKLVKVECMDFSYSLFYRYRKGKKKKYFWGKEIKEGVYVRYLGYRGMEIPDNHILKDGAILIKPCVELCFSNKEETIRYFETYKEAIAFANELTSGKNWLLNN